MEQTIRILMIIASVVNIVSLGIVIRNRYSLAKENEYLTKRNRYLEKENNKEKE